MLGWRILGHGEHKLDLPVLSREEEELIAATEERFKEAMRFRQGGSDSENRQLVAGILGTVAKERGAYLERAQEGYLARAAILHIYGFAFVEPLLCDPSVEEISITGPGQQAYAYIRKEGWKSVNAAFDDERAIAEMANRMARKVGRHITLQNPRLDAMLPDGSRLHASLPPISRGEMTIRKFRERPFSPLELAENGTVPAGALAFLSLVMQGDCSLIIGGNTASGKTTTLNSLFSFVPANERVVITEETPEISLPHRHQLRLVANREMGITLKDLVYDTLRMRPDRMVVGEVRNREEAEALFDVLLAGQARGSYATFHAQSAAEALSRMRSFGISAGDLESVDCIVIQRRMLSYDAKKRKSAELRRVVEIAEPAPGGGTRCIYPCGRPGGCWKGAGILERIAGGFGMDRKEVAAELMRREKIIAEAGRDYAGFYRAVQKELYGFEEP